LSVPAFFDFLRRIPYSPDLRGVEVVSRPAYLLAANWRGLDCKKKAQVAAAYFQEKGIPWRFLAVSSRPDGKAHHTYVQGWINGQWIDFDPTYSDARLGERKQWTKAEVLAGRPAGSAADPVLVSLSGDDLSPAGIADFQARARDLGDPAMGVIATSAIVAIVTAVVAAVGGITAGIINAVSGKRRQEREIVFQRASQALAISTAEAQEKQAAEARTATINKVLTWAGPAAVGLALYAVA